MREIIFKAKRIDNGEWVEGSFTYIDETWENKYIPVIVIKPLCTDCHNVQIYKQNFAEINPKTLCEYAGLTDKNGNKIFEGDLIKNICSQEKFIVEWNVVECGYGFTGKITYTYPELENGNLVNGALKLECIEIIGNIHDTEVTP